MQDKLQHYTRKLGLHNCIQFNTGLLNPEERIRDYCRQDKCGSYNKNHMCPPLVGSLEETRALLSNYHTGILFQYSESLDVSNDKNGLRRTKKEFHKKVLKLEKFLNKHAETDVLGIIGGNCELCKECGALSDEPCRHPRKARPSLESLGIDVIALLEKLGLDNKFHKDRITWTGCILY